MERHLMPASAETEPVEVKYGTSDCNAVVYGDLAVKWGSWQDAPGYPSYGNWQSVTLQTNTPTGRDFWSGSTHIWYTFDYWSLNSTSGAAYSPGQTYSTIANATFYAHWTEHREYDTSY